MCIGKSHVSIALDVTDTNFEIAKQFLHNLIPHFEVSTDVMISIVIGSTGAVTNFPANTPRTDIQNYILTTTNADGVYHDHVSTIQRLESTFSDMATMPRIALLVTDGKSNTAASSAAARAASLKDIQVLSVAVFIIIFIYKRA